MRLFTAGVLFFTACATIPTSPVPDAWRHVEAAPRIDSVAWEGERVVANRALPLPPRNVRVEKTAAGDKLVNGTKELTPPFLAIDSFDVSESRKEIVFSAKRKDNFDVGLVSVDGSDIHWIPEDPSDETNVQWAPRGNKVSYIVHTKSGDIVRTVHVPTAVQVTVDFPWSSIHALAWEPKAERYAVACSTPDASDRVEIAAYDGSKRSTPIPPARRLDVNIDRIAEAIVVRPATMHYNERLPLVVWVTPDVFRWNDARARLENDARVVVAIVKQQPSDSFWKTAAEVPWLDMSRVWVVDPQPATANPRPGTTLITTSNDVHANRYRSEGSIVYTGGGIESFAAGFIAEQLKGQLPPNGNSR